MAARRKPKKPSKDAWRLKAVAYHEAGHYVARIACGRRPMAVEINRDGSGITHGDGKEWRLNGQYEVWEYLVYCLAGVWAEAQACKVSRAAVMLSGGAHDVLGMEPEIEWLVEKGFASDRTAAWRRAEEQTTVFLRERWTDIERKAVALLEDARRKPRKKRAKRKRTYDSIDALMH